MFVVAVRAGARSKATACGTSKGKLRISDRSQTYRLHRKNIQTDGTETQRDRIHTDSIQTGNLQAGRSQTDSIQTEWIHTDGII